LSFAKRPTPLCHFLSSFFHYTKKERRKERKKEKGTAKTRSHQEESFGSTENKPPYTISENRPWDEEKRGRGR